MDSPNLNNEFKKTLLCHLTLHGRTWYQSRAAALKEWRLVVWGAPQSVQLGTWSKWHRRAVPARQRAVLSPCQRREWQCGTTHSSTCCDAVQTGIILWWGITRSCVTMRRHIIALQSISVVPSKFPVQIQRWRWFYCVELLRFCLFCPGRLDMRQNAPSPPAAATSIYGNVSYWTNSLKKRAQWNDTLLNDLRPAESAVCSAARAARSNANSDQIRSFPVSISKRWDGSQHSKLPLHASHVALPT